MVDSEDDLSSSIYFLTRSWTWRFSLVHFLRIGALGAFFWAFYFRFTSALVNVSSFANPQTRQKIGYHNT